jgi:hypothetical protein
VVPSVREGIRERENWMELASEVHATLVRRQFVMAPGAIAQDEKDKEKEKENRKKMCSMDCVNSGKKRKRAGGQEEM